MKMSLCKVHLGMFQYCLAIPRLRVGGLVRGAALRAPGRVGPARTQPPAARCPWHVALQSPLLQAAHLPPPPSA